MHRELRKKAYAMSMQREFGKKACVMIMHRESLGRKPAP
jgi:hypothetical protein